MSNPYKSLLGLLPQRPLQVGAVQSVDAGVAIVELPGGGVIRASFADWMHSPELRAVVSGYTTSHQRHGGANAGGNCGRRGCG